MRQITKFSIILQPNREAFYANETIEGDVFLELNEALFVISLDIYLRGEVCCRFGRNGRSERLAPDNRYHFSEAHLTGQKIVCDQEICLLKEELETGKGSVLHPSGKKTYPFKFTLPNELPSSFEGNWGHIRYTLKANIETDNFNDYEVDLPITIKEIIDANRRLYKEGFTGNAYKTFGIPCFSSSSLEVTGQVDRVCYLPGDVIHIDAQVDNCTNKKMKPLKAKLFQKVRYHYKKKTLIEEMLVAKVVSSQIHKGESLIWKKEPLAVPDISPNMFCELIEIKHVLKLQVNGIIAEIPIIIGTIPYNSPIANTYPCEHNSDMQLPDTSQSSRYNANGIDSTLMKLDDHRNSLLAKESAIDIDDALGELSRCSAY